MNRLYHDLRYCWHKYHFLRSERCPGLTLIPPGRALKRVAKTLIRLREKLMQSAA